jgi:hypothetical protein
VVKQSRVTGKDAEAAVSHAKTAVKLAHGVVRDLSLIAKGGNGRAAKKRGTADLSSEQLA